MRTVAIRRATLGAALLLAITVAACGSASPAADSPSGVVTAAMAKLAAKDIEGLRPLACAGQEDLISRQLGLAGLGDAEQLLPGVDTQALLDAVTLDVSAVELGQATETGDVATVPVKGSVKVTFDAAALKRVLKAFMAEQGTSMTDEQLDALLKTLQQTGQDIPVDESIRLVKESGAWKICQDDVSLPSAS